MENLVMQEKLQNYYKDKKVFLTGHTGFKGAWLMAWLSKLGASVKGYALAPEYKECLFNILQPLNLASHTIADIRDKETLRKEIISFQPDYIFHLAAQPLVRRSYKIPSETFEVNVVGTSNLLEIVNGLNKKCTIVIITTDKVYENKELATHYYDESDRLGGYDPYSASKACTELVVSSFKNSFYRMEDFELHKKAIASARAGNVIGGGDYNDDRIIPDIIKALKQKTVIDVRNPLSVRPWQHVLEPLTGYLLLGGLLAESPKQFSGAYNFGPLPDDHLNVRALVELAIQVWGNGQWKDISSKDQPHESGFLKLNIQKAIKELNWKPKLNAREAIEWTIDWYKQDANLADFTFKQIDQYMSL